MTAIFDWQCDADLMDVEVPDGATEFHSDDVEGIHAMCVEAARHLNAAFASKRRELGLGTPVEHVPSAPKEQDGSEDEVPPVA